MSDFTMPIDEAFAVPDGTVVVVGRVSTGEVRPGDSVDLCTPCKTR
jgi:translation elongation factor EF-Tu-like GTPase